MNNNNTNDNDNNSMIITTFYSDQFRPLITIVIARSSSI